MSTTFTPTTATPNVPFVLDITAPSYHITDNYQVYQDGSSISNNNSLVVNNLGVTAIGLVYSPTYDAIIYFNGGLLYYYRNGTGPTQLTSTAKGDLGFCLAINDSVSSVLIYMVEYTSGYIYRGTLTEVSGSLQFDWDATTWLSNTGGRTLLFSMTYYSDAIYCYYKSTNYITKVPINPDGTAGIPASWWNNGVVLNASTSISYLDFYNGELYFTNEDNPGFKLCKIAVGAGGNADQTVVIGSDAGNDTRTCGLVFKTIDSVPYCFIAGRNNFNTSGIILNVNTGTRVYVTGLSNAFQMAETIDNKLYIGDALKQIDMNKYVFTDVTCSSNTNPLSIVASTGATTYFTIDMSNFTCFLEGTKILYLNNENKEEYIPIEKLRKGMLVKTRTQGFVPVNMIGRSTIINNTSDDRIKDRLYCLPKEKYPELTEDLIITGCHSILVNSLNAEQCEKTVKDLGNIFATEGKYRLMAYLDDKAVPYKEKGIMAIYHLALDCNDYYKNYGVYANGLLAETCSQRYLKELSGMELLGEPVVEEFESSASCEFLPTKMSQISFVN